MVQDGCHSLDGLLAFEANSGSSMSNCNATIYFNIREKCMTYETSVSLTIRNINTCAHKSPKYKYIRLTYCYFFETCKPVSWKST